MSVEGKAEPLLYHRKSPLLLGKKALPAGEEEAKPRSHRLKNVRNAAEARPWLKKKSQWQTQHRNYHGPWQHHGHDPVPSSRDVSKRKKKTDAESCRPSNVLWKPTCSVEGWQATSPGGLPVRKNDERESLCLLPGQKGHQR